MADLPIQPRQDEMGKDLNVDGRPHISASAIGAYKKCGWAYYLGYVQKAPKEYSTHYLFGSVAHKIAEMNARFKIESGKDMPLDELMEKFEALLSKEYQKASADASFMKEFSPNGDITRFEREWAFKQFLASCSHAMKKYWMFSQNLHYVMVEKAFRIKIHEEYDLIGALDFGAFLPGGVFGIGDLKFAKSPAKNYDMDNWLAGAAYALAWASFSENHQLPDTLFIAKFQRLKTKSNMQLHRTVKTVKDVQDFLREADDVVAGIKGDVFEPNGLLTPWLCRYCDFYPCEYARREKEWNP